jgi:hypothetical protein
MILFIDALHRQSKLFRFAMPAAYLLYVLAGCISFGYSQSPHPISPNANSTDALTTAAAEATFEGRISSSLFSIVTIMVSFLYSALYDRSGTAVLFPFSIATVLKSAVPFILRAGTWMKIEVDEDGQRLVLVAKRTDLISPGADEEEEDVRSLPDVPAVPSDDDQTGDAGNIELSDLQGWGGSR